MTIPAQGIPAKNIPLRKRDVVEPVKKPKAPKKAAKE